MTNQAPRDIEELLARLQALLQPSEETLNHAPARPRLPLCLILAPPRSGSTLLLQLMAQSGWFAWPSNILARFAFAPATGALIQRLLTEKRFDPDDNFSDLREGLICHSSFGKTKESINVNEFYHFWRNFFSFDFPRHLSENELNAINSNELQSALRRLTEAFDLPFACKGIALQFNLAHFARLLLPNVVFVHLKRQPFFVMQSIFLARRKINGTEAQWWSVQPKEYERLKDLSVADQIAGQVFYTEEAIANSMSGIPSANKICVDYDQLCHNPWLTLEKIASRCQTLGFQSFPAKKRLPDSLAPSETARLGPAERNSLLQAWERISGQEMTESDQELCLDDDNG